MAEKKNGEQISKKEGMRRALAALGNEASLERLQTFVKDNFGFEMSTKYVATYRGDILKQAAGKGKPPAKEAAARKTASEPQAAAAPPAPPQGPRDQAGSKMDGVRRALSKLGKDATSTRIQALLKDELGIEMSLEQITNYKSKILRKAAAKKATKKPAAQKAAARSIEAPPAAVAAAPMPVAAAPMAASNGYGGIVLEDIVAAKALVQRVGAEQLRRLIEVLAK